MVRIQWIKRTVGVLLISIGIIGNILLVAFFVFARLFVPPFSAEGTPVNELEPNGILTVIIELFLTGLLVYLVKGQTVKQEKPTIDK